MIVLEFTQKRMRYKKCLLRRKASVKNKNNNHFFDFIKQKMDKESVFRNDLCKRANEFRIRFFREQKQIVIFRYWGIYKQVFV